MAEEIPSIDEVIESHNEYNRVRKEFEAMEQTLSESENFSPEELDKQRAQIEQTRENLKQQKVEYYKIAREYIGQRNAWESGLAENLGLSPKDLNFNTFDFSSPDAKPQIKNYLENLFDDNIEGLKKLQKYYGEEGKSIRDSPNTKQRFNEIFKDPMMKMMMGILFLDVIPSLAIWNGTAFWNKKSPKDHAISSIGCYQYNINTEDIRFLKTCGANSSGSCCATKDPKVSLCIKDDDCLSKKVCYTSEECDNGPCIKNGSDPQVECAAGDTCFCQGQTCDNKGDNPTFTCNPCPSPEVSISDQIKSLSICTGGYPLSTCSVSGLICQPKSQDNNGFVHGACQTCDELGSDPETCAKTGSNWITTAVCNDGLTLVTALENMRQYKDNWVPKSVPLLSWMVVVIGIIGFLLTSIWYIKYLIKHGKK